MEHFKSLAALACLGRFVVEVVKLAKGGVVPRWGVPGLTVKTVH